MIHEQNSLQLQTQLVCYYFLKCQGKVNKKYLNSISANTLSDVLGKKEYYNVMKSRWYTIFSFHLVKNYN